MLGVTVVPAVMLDVEADAGRRQAEHDSQWDCEPPGWGDEHQEPIERGEGGEQDGRLQVHRRHIAARLAGLLEVCVHPPTKFGLKLIVPAELELAGIM